MCSLGQATVDTPLIERLTLTNVFPVLRGTVILSAGSSTAFTVYETSWVGEGVFSTYLHIYGLPSSSAAGIGLHCSYRVEIWVGL